MAVVVPWSGAGDEPVARGTTIPASFSKYSGRADPLVRIAALSLASASPDDRRGRVGEISHELLDGVSGKVEVGFQDAGVLAGLGVDRAGEPKSGSDGVAYATELKGPLRPPFTLLRASYPVGVGDGGRWGCRRSWEEPRRGDDHVRRARGADLTPRSLSDPRVTLGPVRLVSAEFEQFVARHFGAQGRAWLDGLPERVERYRRDWRLETECFLPGGLMACCLAVRLSSGGSAVLKLSGPWTPAELECVALRHWNGGPAPCLIRADPGGNALLLERIVPGAQFDGGTSREDVASVARLIGSLHVLAPSDGDVRRLPSLADVVERQIATVGAEARARSAAEADELRPRLERARRRVASLLGGWAGEERLLHGDLENRNILRCHKRGLVAIDPLPCVGDPAYDAGYWIGSEVEPGLREGTGRVLAGCLDLDPDRVKSWASVVALDR